MKFLKKLNFCRVVFALTAGLLLVNNLAWAESGEKLVAAIDHDRILNAADAALADAPFTITKFPAKRSPGSLNDFYSNADYLWPNPDTTNGLPMITRDGMSYPGIFNAHRMEMRNLRDAVAALGAAYKLTGDERYPRKAVELLRVFFLDSKTRMNPNLQYAQMIFGDDRLHGGGIIDGLHLIEVTRAVEAMQSSPAFTPELMAGLKYWFANLSEWMLTSKKGKLEERARSNHAVACWLQIACYGQFTGNAAQVAESRQQFKTVFLPKQMAVDGSFPLELGRTKPYGYSIFQLDNLATLCQVLSTPQDDLWNFELSDGRGIRRAMSYLYPYLADKSKWPLKPDVEAWADWPARQSCLLFGGLALDEPRYLALWKKLPADPANLEVQRNIAITQPLLWLNN